MKKQCETFSKKLEEVFYKKDFFFLFLIEEMRKKVKKIKLSEKIDISRLEDEFF